MKKYIFILLFIPNFLIAQSTEQELKLSFTGDFRFRIEQDWNSQKSDGSYRDNRSRLRYRARFGFTYDYADWVALGMRIRTGDPQKQQDPQLTLGDNFGEFNTLPIGFEKIYAQFNHKWFSGWIGKNTFPFEKQNELFWSDNVFPEGVSLNGTFNLEGQFLQKIELRMGHFIINTNNTSFAADSYFEGLQIVTTLLENKIKLFPSFYYFKNLPNIPDGSDTFALNYAIAHIGTKVVLKESPKLVAGLDYYYNLEDYKDKSEITQTFKNQKDGLVACLHFGNNKKAGDWNCHLAYTYLERYAAVDFLAQNDWVRWDYSSQGSPDGRLTNYKGLEIGGGYSLTKNANLEFRCFFVDQLIPYGIAKENGNRFRLDFNIGF
jgi:hypothetical protein